MRRTRDGVKASTVNRDLQLLKLMFNLIIKHKRWAAVLDNPTIYIVLARENNARVRYLDNKEVQALLQACNDRLRPILAMALRTGMRRGEILNLRWKDADLANRQIFIRRSKSGLSRHVPISEDLFSLRLELPSRFEGGYVFPSHLPRRGSESSGEANEPLVDIKNSFKAALTEAGIKDFRFHDLRHTFASHLVMQGVDLNTVRELLGHKSPQMTLRYAHLSPGHNRDAIQCIDKALGPVCRHTGDTRSDTGKIVPFRTKAK